MSDTAATITTGIAGGIFALAVAYVGYLGGRRQTTDQAAVEHGQWLRGQRQEAYVQFLDAWEKAITEFREMEEVWDAYTPLNPIYQGEDSEERILGAVSDLTQRFVDDVRPFRERVQILGPTHAERAATQLDTTLVELRQELLAIVHGGRWDHFNELMSWTPEQRQMFVKAARDAMRSAPRPGAE